MSGLISITHIPQNTLIFVERPLLARQSLPNAQPTLTCQNCHSFLGNSRIVLPLLSVRMNRCDFCHDDDNKKTTTSGSSTTIIPCRYHCGMLFCSSSCHDDDVINHGHDLKYVPDNSPNNQIITNEKNFNDSPRLNSKCMPLEVTKYIPPRSSRRNNTAISRKRRHVKKMWGEIMHPYAVFLSLPWWE